MWCLLTEEGQQFVGVISMLACFSDYGPYWCSLHLFFPYSAVRRITSCCEFATKVVVKFLQSWCEQLKFVFRHSSVSYLKLTHLKPLKKLESDAQHFLPTSVWCRKMKKYCAFRAKCGGGKKRECVISVHTLSTRWLWSSVSLRYLMKCRSWDVTYIPVFSGVSLSWRGAYFTAFKEDFFFLNPIRPFLTITHNHCRLP